MHILRRAAIFLLPLLCLAGILYLVDKWALHPKDLKSLSGKKELVVETQKKDAEYKLRTVQTLVPASSSVSNKNKTDLASFTY